MDLVSSEGLRIDGRSPKNLRQLSCSLGLYEKPNGSAYIEMGNTKILAAVYGPREVSFFFTLNNSAITPGAAATAAEESKRRKYRGLTDRFIFSPLGFETSGAFGPEAHKVITDIGKRLQRQSGELRERLWLYQRLSLAVQRGNAATIIAAVTAAAPNLRPALRRPQGRVPL